MANQGVAQRTFVEFILEPLYKLVTSTLSEGVEQLKLTALELGLKIKQSEMNLDPKPLLRVMTSRFFGDCGGFTSMIVDKIPGNFCI